METSDQYIDRKMEEIIELIEIGKNAKAIVSFKIEDTVTMLTSGITIPMIICSISINENILKEWKDRR